MKLHCGVLCILKDRLSMDCGYLTLKVYCLVRKMVLWQQTVDAHLKYFATCTFFHTLSIDVRFILINQSFELHKRLFSTGHSNRTQLCR